MAFSHRKGCLKGQKIKVFLKSAPPASQPPPKASPVQALLKGDAGFHSASWVQTVPENETSVGVLGPLLCDRAITRPQNVFGIPKTRDKEERTCLRSTMGDPGFPRRRGLGITGWQGVGAVLVLKGHLHLKVTLNFHGIQSYSSDLFQPCTWARKVAGQLPAWAWVSVSWAICCSGNSL